MIESAPPLNVDAETVTHVLIDLIEGGLEDDWERDIVQDVSGGGKYATIVVNVQGEFFNIAVSQITKARGQKTSYV